MASEPDNLNIVDKPSAPVSEEKQAPKESTGATPSTPEIKIPEPLSALPEKPATEQQLKKVEGEMNAFERSTLRWTKATFGILAVTCAFICLQWCEMRSGSDDAHTLASATERTAHDADESLKRNTEAFKLDEQARIKIIMRENGWDVRLPRTPLVASYQYANTGKTECEIIGTDKHISLIPFREDVEHLIFKPTLPVPDATKTILLPSDQSLISAFNYEVPYSLHESVERKERLIVSWGCIKYKDIFGDLHWADFCDVRLPAPNDSTYARCSYQCQREDKKPN